jgi:hypothetical protein
VHAGRRHWVDIAQPLEIATRQFLDAADPDPPQIEPADVPPTILLPSRLKTIPKPYLQYYSCVSSFATLLTLRQLRMRHMTTTEPLRRSLVGAVPAALLRRLARPV